MKKLHISLAIIAIAATALLNGCISVEDDEPVRTTTTTTSTSPTLLSPSSTTVERTVVRDD